MALAEADAPNAVSSSAGWARIPSEAADPSSALRLADQRMYADKEQRTPHDRRTSPRSHGPAQAPAAEEVIG